MKEIISRVISFIAIWILINFVIDVLRVIKYSIKIKRNSPSWKKASKAFGVRVNKLKKMSKEEIKNMYRSLAKKHHPDVGGNESDFINLNNAYEFAYARAN